MKLLELYERDLKSYEELKQEIQSVRIYSENNLEIYDVIDKLNKIYYFINIFDKYYNIKSIIEGKENNNIEKIIKLYSYFEYTQNNIISNIITHVDINNIDEDYKIYIQNIMKSSKKNDNYEELYKESEAIFHTVTKQKINIKEKIEYLKKYVALKEQMANILGYSSFLDYKLCELGINKDLFINLINLKLEKRIIKENKFQKNYSLEQAYKIITNISSDYLDSEIMAKLFNNVILNDKSFVLNSYRKEPIIFINFSNNLESVDRLFHELSHAYHYKIANDNKLISYNPNQFISEMFSMFNEIIFLNKVDDDNKNNVFNLIFNNFFVDAIKSLKLEYYVHQNYKTLNEDLLNIFDIDFEKHIDFIFNDYYDINYALGFVIAILLENKLINNDIDFKQIDTLLKTNGNLEIDKLLKIIDINVNGPIYDDFISCLKYYNIESKVL